MNAPQPRIIAATADDPLWYKDAIIYQMHVKSFFDSNNDGVGDFPGLMQKLDYIAELGVNTIWLLPFYPSPRRDDSRLRRVHDTPPGAMRQIANGSSCGSSRTRCSLPVQTNL